MNIKISGNSSFSAHLKKNKIEIVKLNHEKKEQKRGKWFNEIY